MGIFSIHAGWETSAVGHVLVPLSSPSLVKASLKTQRPQGPWVFVSPGESCLSED